MKKTVALLVCLLALVAPLCAGRNEVRRLTITYEYTSNNQDESPAQARRNAIEHAKVKAMEDCFGIDVSMVNSILQRNRVDGDNARSTTDVFSQRETSVRGIWLETLAEEVLRQEYREGFWTVEVHLEGKARNKSTEKVDIRYALVRDPSDEVHCDRFRDGDRMSIRFSSPADGSLCVYLVDADQKMAYCLLPLGSSRLGYEPIEANREYVFTGGNGRGYDLMTDLDIEQNTLYFIFTPNRLTKANDSGRNTSADNLLRDLPYHDLMSWLSRNQTTDPDLVVRNEVISIRR